MALKSKGPPLEGTFDCVMSNCVEKACWGLPWCGCC